MCIRDRYKGVIIDKITGEIFQPGNAYILEKWIWGFKLGFRAKRLDFTIKKINDERRAIELISNLGIKYVTPKLEYGIIWKIPKTFNPKEIKKKNFKTSLYFQESRIDNGFRYYSENYK